MRRPGRDRRTAAAAGWLLLALAAPVASAAQAGEDAPPEHLLRGREVRLQVGSEWLRGELLAVQSDTAWLLLEEGVEAVSLDGVGRVRVRQHDMGRTAAWWALVGGVLTGGALALACSSIEEDDFDASCGSVFPVVLGAWAVVGGLSVAALAGTGELAVSSADPALPGYARFPQGLPAAFRAGLTVAVGGKP